MKKISILLVALSFTILMATGGAQADIAWDFTYEGDVDLSDPNTGWTEEGTGTGTVTQITDPNVPVDYLQIDTFDTGSGETRIFVAPGDSYNADFATGMTLVFRARFYDGFMHNYGPSFGDGTYGLEMRFLFSTADAHFPGALRFEDRDQRVYVNVVNVPGLDLSEWNEYRIAITDTHYDFYINDVFLRSGIPSGPGGGDSPTDDRFRFGDLFGSAANEDLKADTDYIRMYFGGAIGAGEGACGDMAHPYPTGDLTEDCYVDLSDYAAYASDWLTDNRP